MFAGIPTTPYTSPDAAESKIIDIDNRFRDLEVIFIKRIIQQQYLKGIPRESIRELAKSIEVRETGLAALKYGTRFLSSWMFPIRYLYIGFPLFLIFFLSNN